MPSFQHLRRLSVALSELRGHRRLAQTYFEVRQELLSTDLANRTLTLREVLRAARDLSGDARDLRMYGMPTLLWYAMGIRISGRTAVEVTRDPQAIFLANATSTTLQTHGHHVQDIVDPFIGSGNLLYHFVRATGATWALGIDSDPDVITLTRNNLHQLVRRRRLRGVTVELLQNDWAKCTSMLRSRPTLVIVMPPWGDAFSYVGLDLHRTVPPVVEILAALRAHRGDEPLFAFVHTVPQLVAGSADDITREYRIFETVRSDDPGIGTRVDYLLLQIR